MRGGGQFEAGWLKPAPGARQHVRCLAGPFCATADRCLLWRLPRGGCTAALLLLERDGGFCPLPPSRSVRALSMSCDHTRAIYSPIFGGRGGVITIWWARALGDENVPRSCAAARLRSLTVFRYNVRPEPTYA